MRPNQFLVRWGHNVALPKAFVHPPTAITAR